MKKILNVCLAGVLFFLACNNQNSSTVGTYETPEEASSTEKNEEHAKGHSGEHAQEQQAKDETSKTDTIKADMEDTSKPAIH